MLLSSSNHECSLPIIAQNRNIGNWHEKYKNRETKEHREIHDFMNI